MQNRYESPDHERPENEAPAYPSFLARTGAFLIDWAVVLLLSAFIATGANADDAGRFVILLVVISLYELGFLLAIGATPGKMAIRMHIADPEGKRLDPDKLILRYLIFFVGILLIVGIPVSAVMVLTDPHRRALHDRIAGTRVHPGRPAWLEQGTRN
jgi:uncharacterized RDD family membrane protein YckC